MRQPSLPIVSTLAALALVVASCSGDDSAEPVDDTSPPPSEATDDGSDASTASTTSAPTTTTVPPVVTVEPEEIHDLVVEWAEGTGDPVDLAVRVTGLPVAVPVAEGSTPHSVSARLFDVRTDQPFVWDWTYEAFASGPVGDVDITLDDNGPGAVELRETYDEIMGELGWSYSNSTASDPGEPGGPNSVNHVYVADAETITVAGVDATPRPAFVWLEDDLVFGPPETPGFQVDMSFDLVEDVIPVPILAALADALPDADGARLFSAQLRSLERADDSFDAEEGLRYLDAALVWRLPAGSEEAARELFSTGLDGDVVRTGEESFVDEGTIEPAEPVVVDTQWTQPVIVVGRYEGTISIGPADDDSGEVVVAFAVRMEPNREVLTPAE